MSDNSLVRQQFESSLDSDLRSAVRDAETVMLLVDTSSSMSGPVDPREYTGRRCIDALRDAVKDLKRGGMQVPMIAFGGPWEAPVRFVDDPPEPYGGTPLHTAIAYAKEYGATRLVVVSDGMPDLKDESLTQARLFGGRIDVVFVGSDKTGETFLKALAAATGGELLTGSLADQKQIGKAILGFLEGPKEPERAPLQGAGFAVVDSDDEPEDEEDDDEEADDEDEEE